MREDREPRMLRNTIKSSIISTERSVHASLRPFAIPFCKIEINFTIYLRAFDRLTYVIYKKKRELAFADENRLALTREIEYRSGDGLSEKWVHGRRIRGGWGRLNEKWNKAKLARPENPRACKETRRGTRLKEPCALTVLRPVQVKSEVSFGHGCASSRFSLSRNSDYPKSRVIALECS